MSSSIPPVPPGDTTVRSITTRYLVMHGLRWLPTGLLIPIMVLLFTSRGLSLAEFGVVTSIMTTTTFLLELPTGGLADALGRRRVLLTGSAFAIASRSVLVVIAWSTQRPALWVAAAAGLLMGTYRALESGPLDAWFVDSLQAVDDDADVEAGLGKSGTVSGFSIAGGSLLAGGIIAWDPVADIEPMAVIMLVAVVLSVVQIAMTAVLMDEVRPPLGTGVLWSTVRDVPRVMRETVALARTSRVLAWLLAIEVTVSVGMVAFENLFPVRLEILSGSTDTAAALMGPIAAGAWAASGIGAALAPRLSRRLGPYRAAMVLRCLQAATIVTMGLLAGVVGIIAAFVGTYLVHGATNPVHLGLLHRQVTADTRATLLSLHSMTAFAAYSAAAIAIGAVADMWSPATGMFVCGAITILGMAGYLIARGHDDTIHDGNAKVGARSTVLS